MAVPFRKRVVQYGRERIYRYIRISDRGAPIVDLSWSNTDYLKGPAAGRDVFANYRWIGLETSPPELLVQNSDKRSVPNILLLVKRASHGNGKPRDLKEC